MNNKMNLEDLIERRKQLEISYEEAVKASIEADGKMQSRYDTQKEEWAGRANLIAMQIQQIDQTISRLKEELSTASKTPPNEVIVGSRVTLQIDEDEPETFIVLDLGGGTNVSNYQILSTSSPIGKAILGHRIGDKLVVQVNNNNLKIKVLAIMSLIDE